VVGTEVTTTMKRGMLVEVRRLWSYRARLPERGYYATLLPGAEHYFPQPTDRTAVNEVLDIGRRSTWRGVVLTTSSTVLNCIVGGAGVALGLRQAGLAESAAIVIGVLAGLLLLVGFASYQIRQFTRLEARVVATS
jgi:hypothetical protein